MPIDDTPREDEQEQSRPVSDVEQSTEEVEKAATEELEETVNPADAQEQRTPR